MIHVVTAENRCLYGEALAEMHRLRPQHCEDERSPADVRLRDGEYDAFDDDRAVYLLSLDAEGRVGCAMRLRPAASGCILSRSFPHLVARDEPPLEAPGVWEISRYFAASQCLGGAGVQIRAEIRLAALEALLARGARRLVGVVDLAILPRLMSASGWRVRPLGLPGTGVTGVLQAIEVEVSAAAAAELAETFALRPEVCLELDPARVAGVPPHEMESLLRLARSRSDESRVIIALVRRILAIQEEADESQLLGMVAYVEALLRAEARPAH